MKTYPIYLLFLFLILNSSCGDEPPRVTTMDGKDVPPEVAEALLRVLRDNGDTSAYNALSKAVEKDSWVDVVDDQAGFQIQFPYQPKKDQKTQVIGERKVVWDDYGLNTQKLNDPNLAYSISFTSDESITNPDYFESFVKTQVKYLERATNSTLETDLVIDMEKGLGREQVYTMNGNDLQVKYRIILRDDRMYLISVITAKENLFNIDIKRFFQSLEFLDVQKTDKVNTEYM